MLFLKLAGGTNHKPCFAVALLILNGCMRCVVLGSTNTSDNTNINHPLPGVIASIRTPLADPPIDKSDWGNRQRPTGIDGSVQPIPGGESSEPTPDSFSEIAGPSDEPPSTTPPSNDTRDPFARRLNFKRAKISTTTESPPRNDETTSNRVSDHFASEEAAHGDVLGEVLQLDRPPSDSPASTARPLMAKRVVPLERATTQRIEIPHEDRQSGHQSESSFDVEYAHHQDGTESYWEPTRMTPSTEPPTTNSPTANPPFTTPSSGGTSNRPRFRTSLRRANTSSVRVTSARPSIVEVDTQPDEVYHNHQLDLVLPDVTTNSSSIGGSDNVIGNHGLFAPLNIPDHLTNQSEITPVKPETNTINANWPETNGSDTTLASGAVPALDNVLGPSGPMVPHLFAVTNLTEDSSVESAVDGTTLPELHDLYKPTPVPRPMINWSDGIIHLYTITTLETSMQTVGVNSSKLTNTLSTATLSTETVNTATVNTDTVSTATVNTAATEEWTNVLEVPEMVRNQTSPVWETTESTRQFLDAGTSVSNNSGDWRSLESTVSTVDGHNGSSMGSTVSIKNSGLMASSVLEYTPPLNSRIFYTIPSSSGIYSSMGMAFEIISPTPTMFSVTQTEWPPLVDENHGVVFNVSKVLKNETLRTRATDENPTMVSSLKPIGGDDKLEIVTTPVVTFGKSDKNESIQTSSPTVPSLNLTSALLPSPSFSPEVMETASPTLEWTTDYSEELSSSMLDDGINETELIATVKMENSLETVTLDQPDTNNVVTDSGLVSSTLVIGPSSSTAMGDGNTKHDSIPKEKNPVSSLDTKHDYALPTIKVPLVSLLVTLKCTWAYFCQRREELQQDFSNHLAYAMKMKILDSQIVFYNINACNHIQNENDVNHNYPTVINVTMYVADKDGSYSVQLTTLLGDLISKGHHRVAGNNSTLHDLVVAVQLHGKNSPVLGQSPPEESDMGIIAAITISSIAATCLVLLCILLIVLKRRQGAQQQRTRRCRPVTDAYSLDSISIYSSFCKRKLRASKRSYLNQGFEDPQSPTNKINFAGLANFCLDDTALNEEYKQIPMTMAKLGELPQGTEIKNRYANVIPFPETRVLLTAKPDDPCSDYINANYVRGFRGAPKSYIACQAPLEHTVVDFWQMVWENQCKVIIMLTNMEEDGVSKCATYFAESDTIDSHRLFGDYQVTTKKKDKRETYVVSYIQLKNLEKNLMREVVHFWYTAWPTHSTPQDHVSVAEMLVEARPSIKINQGPTIVHCSTGTGRTGAVIAINICIQEFETSRTVDIPKVVYRLRQDRGGLVQTPEQYIFIYQVLNEFASKIMNHSERSSLRSSR